MSVPPLGGSVPTTPGSGTIEVHSSRRIGSFGCPSRGRRSFEGIIRPEQERVDVEGCPEVDLVRVSCIVKDGTSHQ